MLGIYYCFGLVVCVDLVWGFSFVFLDRLIGLPLCKVGFACALVHIKAIVVACWDPGIVHIVLLQLFLKMGLESHRH